MACRRLGVSTVCSRNLQDGHQSAVNSTISGSFFSSERNVSARNVSHGAGSGAGCTLHQMEPHTIRSASAPVKSFCGPEARKPPQWPHIHAASAQTSAAQPKPVRLAPIVSACASSSVYSGTVPASARTICQPDPSTTGSQPPRP